jgi:hypothetical protein
MRPIYEAQTEAALHHAQVVADYLDRLQAWKNASKAERGDSPCEPPPYPHRYLSDCTVEAIALRLTEQPRGLVVALDELSGFFSSLGQYKNGKGNDRESYLAFYDAGAAKIDRKSSTPPTVFIPHAFITVTGMIQPGTLVRALGTAEFDSGLAARFLFAAPPPLRSTWSNVEMREQARSGWRDLIVGLLSHPLPETPALIPPSDAAMTLWAIAHDRLEGERHQEPDDRLRAARSKLIGMIPRLSLIFQMVSAASGERHAQVRLIDELSMRRAVAVAEWGTRETSRVYGMLATQGDDSDETKVIRVIEDRGGQITTRQLMRSCRMFRASAEKAEGYLESMVHDGLGHWEHRSTGGHPARMFILNSSCDGAVSGGNSGDRSPPSGGVSGDTSPDGAIANKACVTVTAVTGELQEERGTGSGTESGKGARP